jgi:hypothetical protein
MSNPKIDSNSLITSEKSGHKATANLTRVLGNFFIKCNAVQRIDSRNIVLTTNDFMCVRLFRWPRTTGIVDTTPTAAQFVAAMQSRHGLGSNMPVNTGFTMFMDYLASGSNHTYTMVGGTGVTLLGSSFAGYQRTFNLITIIATNITSGQEAVTMIFKNGLI